MPRNVNSLALALAAAGTGTAARTRASNLPSAESAGPKVEERFMTDDGCVEEAVVTPSTS